MKTVRIVLVILYLGTSVSSALAQPMDLVNGDFEGNSLDGWFVPKSASDAGWAASVDRGRAAVIQHEGSEEPNSFGNLMQTMSAKAYQGKRIRLAAMVRAGGSPGVRSQLWLRVDRPNEQPGFFDNCSDRPVSSDTWQRVEIIGDLADDSVSLAFGLTIFGKGAQAGLDNVSLEVVGAASEFTSTKPLTDRGLANVIAFVRLQGYVRYFHPSDQAAAMSEVDWTRFTIAGIDSVEPLADANALATKLQALFSPIAPTVEVAAGASIQPTPLVSGKYVRAWQHDGFGPGRGPTEAGNVYSSQRLRLPAKNDKNARGGSSLDAIAGFLGLDGNGLRPGFNIADPDQPWTRELGGGVICSVPLTVFDDGTTTLPKPTGPTFKAATTSPTAYSPADRPCRLAVIASAWNIMQHYYPYFDQVKTDWPKSLPVALQEAATASDAAGCLRSLQHLGAALKDGHCIVHGPGETLATAPEVRLVWADERLCVAESRVPGLAPGDALLEIDGRPVEQISQEMLSLISVPSPQGGRVKTEWKILNGPLESNVRLTVEPFLALGTRREVLAKRTLDRPYFSPQRDRLKELAPGVFYVDLEQWKQAEIDAEWKNWCRARAMIFEHRNYPMGLDSHVFFARFSSENVTSAQFLTPIITRPDFLDVRYPAERGWKISARQPQIKCPVAFLMDANCISYAESNLSIVEHHRLGALVGAPTMGTNGDIVMASLPGGYSISFTGMKVLKQDGSPHHGVGILPTVPAVPTRKGLAEGRDEVIEAALAHVLAQIAHNPIQAKP